MLISTIDQINLHVLYSNIQLQALDEIRFSHNINMANPLEKQCFIYLLEWWFNWEEAWTILKWTGINYITAAAA